MFLLCARFHRSNVVNNWYSGRVFLRRKLLWCEMQKNPSLGNKMISISGRSSRKHNFIATLKVSNLVGTLPVVTATISYLARFGVKRAFCVVNNEEHDRRAGLQVNLGKVDMPFDWYQFWKMLKPDIWIVIGAIISALIVAAINIHIPTLIGEFINILSRNPNPANFTSQLKKPALHLICIFSFQSIFTFLYISALSCVGERLACRIRKQLFDVIVRQDISFFDRHRTGELISRLTDDVQDFKSSFKLCISQGLRSFTQTTGYVLSLYFISPKMTGVVVVVLPVVIFLGTMFGSMLRKLSHRAQEQAAKATAIADEAISNVRTVRSFAMEEKESSLYEGEVERGALLNERLGIGIGAFQGLANFTLNGVVLGVLYMGGYLMSSSELSGGQLMAFLMSAQAIQRSLGQLSLLFGQYVRGISAGARVLELVKLQANIPVTGGFKIPYHMLIGDLEFRNVTFSYPSRPNQVILHNFNLRIPAGRIVAICGPSGGGKSTIAALLERFYDVDEGSVMIDGKDIRSLDPSWLRGSVIGFISQEPVLFATSVLENIRYGKPTATDQEVFEAAKIANADTFIRQFPDGYDTVLGERGVTVSGGQKQRIAIARAMLKNPSVLILDEATSALDAESEKVVQDALDLAVKGRTVLVIAHRLSTIQNADTIAVLAGGVIAEMGTHEALTKLRGLYWDLIRQQQKVEAIHMKFNENLRSPGRAN